jgi:FkbM family methyltransferase
MHSFSQTNEQDIILRHFADCCCGNFLDIGAHDGESLSNTRALALSGWSGTFVEPNPNLFLRLVNLYGTDARFTLINSAMSDKSGLTRFFYDGSANQFSSSIAQNVQELFPETPYPISYLLNAISPCDLAGQHFDFVSIDTEGYDLAILKAFRGMLSNTSLICIEYNYTDAESTEQITDELLLQGFSVSNKTRENILAIKS